MQLGTLNSRQRFRVVGWENGPVLETRYGPNYPAKITIWEPSGPGDYVELKTGVIADSGSHDVSEILRTTHILPASTEVELVD